MAKSILEDQAASIDGICDKKIDALSEMLEFGFSLEHALRMESAMDQLLNHPRGLGDALIEMEPEIAIKLGLIKVQ